ncbi:peptidase M23 [Aliidiomarina minuta]|uniref:Peptidase M23 n=1 Tax=Aliidiomarina minuta TaxID=880057 RepID=A0A432W489_9GAMM|nr:peptidoglycan DD-metalloendopeptidase family protein [Aliidiomarina minuta]RUO24296.1 peptidase M23 [Aliidiomarina minuta]
MTQFIHHLPRQHRIVIALLLGLLLIIALLPSEQASASRNTSDVDEIELGKRYQLELQLHEAELAEQELGADIEWQNYEVRSGDSMARIFQRLGFSAQELHRVTQAEDADTILRRIHPGNTLRFANNEDGELVQVLYELNELDTFLITRDEEGRFYSERESKEFEVRLGFANATITSSFWNAGVQAGLTQGQIMSLAELFGWDIDFALDIRPGDNFSVLYEQRYIDGEFAGYGRIVAAEFENQGDNFQAVRHENGDYYTPEGKNMRQSFLRAPVSFNRVSSDFNPRRTHPVTGRVRPHNGIDYAAAVGTPVMASGDGRVIRSGYNDLNGNYIFIQHGERYITKYLHLNRRHVQQGARVRQGQTIGTVGATGRVTGPHLHYEFLVDGVHRNPRTVDLPAAESLDPDKMPDFKVIAEQRLAKLESQRRIMLAMND